MRAFAALPAASGVEMELALDIDAADAADADLLREGGWRLVPPERAGDDADLPPLRPDSRAEVGVAKDMYVRSRGGWLSDRSLCYLASGKPVIVQATGFERELETGLGLLSFADFEEATAAVAAVEGAYERHSAAARELAGARFDSDRVLPALLEAVA